MSGRSKPSETAADYRPLVLLLVGLLLVFVIVGRQLRAGGCLKEIAPARPFIYLWVRKGDDVGGYRFADRLAVRHFLAGLTRQAGDFEVQPANLATVEVNGASLSILPGPHPRLAALFELPLPINHADQEELQTLPGIGPKLAAAIVRSRLEQGPFKSLDDLRRVRGIGPKKLARLRDLITLN